MPRFQKISCTLKQLLKTINNCYNALLVLFKQDLSDFTNSFALKQSCVEFLYDSFLRSCGIKQLTEKKFAQTLSSVMKYQAKIQRVRLFGRFLGLFDPLDKECFKFYMICLNYILNVSTFGYLIPANDYDEIQYVPYIRVNDFIRTFFENRIQQEDYQELKLQVSLLNRSMILPS